jgi:acetyl-CoA carboxylase beta subunit
MPKLLKIQKKKKRIPMRVTKCPHCKKVFFETDSEVCPFCKRSLKEDLNIFRDMLGDDNPFKDFLSGEK